MKIGWFDAPSGISGDMFLAALLDLGGSGGFDSQRLEDGLACLGVDGWRLESSETSVDGLRARRLEVIVDEGVTVRRDWSSIRSLLEEAPARGFPAAAAGIALSIFEKLAAAEARVHGSTPEEVHFHEVGAVDSIVDIAGVAWCLDRLGIERCFCGPLPAGSGTVVCEHGTLPVPVPAVVELLAGFELVAGDGQGETVTPTGAAILSALAVPARPVFTLEACGSGAGSRQMDDRPNVLRILLGHCEAHDDEQVIAIVADVDDMTAEAIAFVAERLRGAGARDVSVVPVGMKKGRLGNRLEVLADVGTVHELAHLLLTHSSTAGLRFRAMGRVVLPRRVELMDTEFGPVAVKFIVRPDGSETAEPEFDDLARIALQQGLAFEEIRRAVLASLPGSAVSD